MMEYRQIALKNLGKIDPLNIQDYINAGGFIALSKVVELDDKEILLNEIIKSGLRGRGGAGFPTGLKLQFVSRETSTVKYIICNADEGEPGTFKDRVIMENDPHLLVEGMIIAAYLCGASRGFVYIRGEYYKSIQSVEQAIQNAYEKSFLGKNILGKGYSFDLEVRYGAGSYLCGEELTLIESMEGKRGYPRIKPPYPAQNGLFGKPTLVNNVETICHLPDIVRFGAQWYREAGTEKSPGTKIFTVSGSVNKPGYYELPLGVSLRLIINDFAGGMKSGLKFKAALLGGAAGTFVDAGMLDQPMGYDELASQGATLGSGAIIVLSEKDSVTNVLTSVLDFFAHESCGKCVPCRVGTHHLLQKARQLNKDEEKDSRFLNEMLTSSEIIAKTCLCPLGQSPVLPLRSAIRYFENELLTNQQK
jgi:NADH-quinone oxidoreductase subunit F